MTTISLKMTWSGALAPLLAVYADGSAEGRKDAIGELRRMARCADLAAELLPPARRGAILAALEMLRAEMDADGADFLPGADMTAGGTAAPLDAAGVGEIIELLRDPTIY